MIKSSRMTVILLAVVATAGIGAVSAAATVGNGTSGPAPIEPPYVVRDATGDLTLSVQLQPGVRNTGSFDFSVNGVGDWAGTIPIKAAGPHVTRLTGSATGVSFQAAGASTTVPAEVRMHGEVTPKDESATVDLWVTRPGSARESHYLLKTARPDLGEAREAARRAAVALEAEDWHAIYRMAASTITQQYTEAQFMRAMSSQQQPGMRKVALYGRGTVNVSSGITYFVQPIRFGTAGSEDMADTYTANLMLVWEQTSRWERGTWHFAGTTQPSS